MNNSQTDVNCILNQNESKEIEGETNKVYTWSKKTSILQSHSSIKIKTNNGEKIKLKERVSNTSNQVKSKISRFSFKVRNKKLE